MPIDLSPYAGLRFRLRAGALRYSDTAMTTAQNTHGGQVKGWGDSVSGDHFTYTTAGSTTGPTLQVGATQTGQDALRFLSTTLLTNTTAGYLLRDPQACVFFAVVRANQVDALILSWYTAGANDYGYWRIRVASYTPDAQICYRRTNDTTPAEDKVDIGNNWCVVIFEYVPATTKTWCYTNNNAGSSATSPTTTANNTITNLTLGGLVTASNPNGVAGLFAAYDLAELIAFEANLTTAERMEIVNLLAAEYLGAPPAPEPAALAISGGVEVSWPEALGAEAYLVQYSADGSTGWTTLDTVTAPRLYYADTGTAGRTAGVTRYYRVIATNLAGSSLPSSVVSAAPLGAPTSEAQIAGGLLDYWNPDMLGSGGISSYPGAINGLAWVQGTSGNQPQRAANPGGGTATYVESYDGSNDYTTLNGSASALEGDVSVVTAETLGSGAGRTGNECRLIACGSTDAQTLDFQAIRASGSGVQIHCRLNDGLTQSNVGGFSIDTDPHLIGFSSGQDGLGQLFWDGAVTPLLRLRPAGGALTFTKLVWGEHFRVTHEAPALAKYGRKAIWRRVLNAYQWSQVKTLYQPLYGTPTTPEAHPVVFMENLLSSHWAAAFLTQAGGTLADNTAFGNNHQWSPEFRAYAEFTKSTTSVVYRTNASPTGRPCCELGSGGFWQENTAANIATPFSGSGDRTWAFVAQLTTLSGAVQSFGGFSDNGASGTYLSVRVNAAGQWEVAGKDDAGNVFSAAGGTADTAIHLFELSRSGTALELRVDGAVKASVTLAGGATFTLTRHYYGGDYRGSFANGATGARYWHVWTCTAAQSGTARTALQGYCVDRYGTPAALTNYSVTADYGAFTLSGQATGLRAARQVAAVSGSLTANGQDAALRATRILAGAVGSFTLTGESAAILRGLKLAAGAGEFTLSGQAAALLATRRMSAGAGLYALTGQDAALLFAGTIRATYTYSITARRLEKSSVAAARIAKSTAEAS